MSQKCEPLQLSVKLSHVTVFLRGAELLSSGRIEIPAGECEVILNQVASAVHEQSLSVSASNGVTVLSASVCADHLDGGVLTEMAREIQDRLERKRVERQCLHVQMNVQEEKVRVLQANRQLAPAGIRGGVSVVDLGAMVDFIAQRTENAWEKQLELGIKVEKLDGEIASLESQLEEENGKDIKAAGKVVLRLLSEQAVQTDIRISYMTYDASWSPSYDLRVDEIGAPVHLVYKARLFQNSGIHWDDVLLTLSTGNPSQGAQMPVLYPWYIRKEQAHSTSVYAAEMMHEVAESSAMMKCSKAVRSNTLEAYVTTNTQGLNVSFDIALPYTIPCDGKGHMVMIQEAHVPADYCYVTAPRVDTDAFLEARIMDWQALNLMPGQSSIYFEGVYVGQGYIDFTQIRQGVGISLGREKRIVVKRVEDENHRSKAGLLGGDVQRTFAYTIDVENARSDAVKVLIKDQLPVSQDNDIGVIDLELAGAAHDKRTGMLEWEYLIQGNGSVCIAYSYGVRFGKDVVVDGL